MSKSENPTHPAAATNLTDFETAYVAKWLETHKRAALVYLLLTGLEDSPKWSGELTTYIDKATEGAWTVDERSLYRALRRLQNQGLVDHTRQQSEGPGASRKVYSITTSGTRIVQTLAATTKMYGP